MVAAVRGALVLLAVLVIGLVLTPVQYVIMRRPGARQGGLALTYWRIVAWLLRLKIIVVGDMSRAHPTLFVANHVSWIDIIVYGAIVDARFVAKREVARWPLIGGLARLGGTVFIERKARRTADQRDLMVEHLQNGDNLILFPEGTSNDGLRTLPFKSAFFSLAETKMTNGQPIAVQPISLAYVRLGGLPVGRRWMPIFAWIGDQDLLPHLWQFVTHGAAEAVLEFHPPVTIDRFASRKDLARWSHEVVALGVSDAHAGRVGRRPAPPG